jgi:hypothetical protein
MRYTGTDETLGAPRPYAAHAKDDNAYFSQCLHTVFAQKQGGTIEYFLLCSCAHTLYFDAKVCICIEFFYSFLAFRSLNRNFAQ